MEAKAKKEETAVAKREPTHSERFTSMVVREFSNQVGRLELTPYQERLAQHMFVAIDNQLKALEAKRKDQNAAVIDWKNINMNKLAVDAVHRVELGLDALIPNHIHPIPYFNGRTKKYDLDLRIGYAGKDCYRRKMAKDEPVDIVYELVYSNDTFKPIKKSLKNDVESYDFEITNPFDRGEVIGGFGYIAYEDPRKNKLVIVTKADFDKSKKAAQSEKFWKDHEREMQYKTLVHRTTEKIGIDPEKVNASFLRVEIDDDIQAAEREADENGNKDWIEGEFTEGKQKKGGDADGHRGEVSQGDTTIPGEVTDPPPQPNGEGGNGKSLTDEILQREEALGEEAVLEILKKHGIQKKEGFKPGERKQVVAALKDVDKQIDKELEGVEGPDF